MSRICFVNGAFLPDDEDAIAIMARGFRCPDDI